MENLECQTTKYDNINLKVLNLCIFIYVRFEKSIEKH
jgi:hypothetical protein